MADLQSQLREARAAVDRLDIALVTALATVARETAERIVVAYQQRLLAQTNARKTAASARVLDESAEKQFLVNVPGHPSDPANLAAWLEYGTRNMVAKPSLRPSIDEQRERYQQDMTQAVQQTMSDALKVLL